MIKVCKIKILKPIDCEYSEFYQILRDLLYYNYKASNTTINELFYYHITREKYKKENGKYPTKDELPEPDLYNIISTAFTMFPKYSISMIQQESRKRLRNDIKQGLLKGERTLSTFRRNAPIPLGECGIKLISNNGKYTARLSLRPEVYGKTNFLVQMIVDRDYAKAIVDRIISGEYKLKNSYILYKMQNREWFLNLCYDFGENKEKSLDPNIVVGVDIGINTPAYVAINNGFERLQIGNGDAIRQFRQQVEQRRIRLLRTNNKYHDLRSGHGRKRKLKPIDYLSEKIKNFRNTMNHTFAKAIINFTLEHRAGIIQMEDLSKEITKDNVFLTKNWTFFDLRTKIENKAKEVGIEVNIIDPKYTSQRCSKCGYIDAENRPKDKDGWKKFECTKCGYSENADYNAAKNISLTNIEEVIRKTLEKSNTEEKANDINF